MAGGPSVTKLTQSNYTDVKLSGIPRRAVKKIERTSPIFDEIRYLMNAFILLYIDLPSSIAFTIVAKLSSANTISDANFATSVPDSPIAIPIWAYFKAGASLTPSPVIATISPYSINNFTSSYLWAGSTLAKTFPDDPSIAFFLY